MAELDVRDETLIDAEVLLAACGEDGTILERIRETLQAHLPAELRRAEACLGAGDPGALREAAHRLSGMVSTVSSSAGALAAELEDQAALGSLDDAGAMLERLRRMIDEIFAGLNGLTLERLQLQRRLELPR